MKNSSEKLKTAVDQKRREISSDNLSMSIGELLNLYKDSELDIHPEFQRVFRWLPEQKSRLIESLLLGIPLPPIYVATDEAGKWEVIDGVQRLSTIFEFMGELVGPPRGEGPLEKKPEFVLSATKHLPELLDVKFSKMDQALKLEFKRTRLDVKVLSRDSSGRNTGKFDLFERLNTYGQPLSPQELRNCVLVSLSSAKFKWLENLSNNENFRNCTILSETQLLERYDMDLALRFLTLRDKSASSEVKDVHDFLRDKMEEIAVDPGYDIQKETKLFNEVFAFLDDAAGSNAFRSWNIERQEFRGGFSLGAFEGIAIVIGRHWPSIRRRGKAFDGLDFIKKVWGEPEYQKSFSGMRARERMIRVLPAVERVMQSFLPKLVSKPAAKTASKPVVKPVAKTVAKPATKSAAKPVKVSKPSKIARS